MEPSQWWLDFLASQEGPGAAPHGAEASGDLEQQAIPRVVQGRPETDERTGIRRARGAA